MGERCFCFLHQRLRHKTWLLRAPGKGTRHEATLRTLFSLAAPEPAPSRKAASLPLARLGGVCPDPFRAGRTNTHCAGVDEAPAPCSGAAGPSQAAFTHLQPHVEVPVGQQVQAPLHHVLGQLSVAWQRSFPFGVRAVQLWLRKVGTLIWKTEPLLKP